MSQTWGSLVATWDSLVATGAGCRSALDAADFADFAFAKACWHLTIFAPLALYVVGAANDAAPRFPITISWTVRRGLGRVVFHCCWVVGWLRFLRPLVRHRDACGASLAASLQMWATGVVAISLSPVGVSDAVDLRHYASSGKYMVDHAVMMQLFDVGGSFARGFVASLLLFFVATFYLKVVKSKHGEDVPADATNDFRAAQRAKLPPAARREIGLVEFAEMVFEYGLFTCFVAGIPARLP